MHKTPDLNARNALSTYRAKRRFDVTAEPSGEAGAVPSDQPRFMVHKHDATRLHYDVRLEIDGVLASWACPKGPSYDPAQKRLAVQTEDHPLEYGDFEGRIPDGQYGAGDSIIWDRGTWDTVPPGQATAQWKKGHLHVALHGEKLEGEWHLVRTRAQGGKDQWLMFKAKDGTERDGYDVIAERPESVVSGRRVTRGPVRKAKFHAAPQALLKKVAPDGPMLATLSEPKQAPASDDFHEVKHDGLRALAAVAGGQVAVVSRNGLDLLDRFPWAAEALARIEANDAVLDGELTAAGGFQHLGDGQAEHRFVAFDLLWLDGEDLRARPVEERRALLESVVANAGPLLHGTIDAVEQPRKAKGLFLAQPIAGFGVWHSNREELPPVPVEVPRTSQARVLFPKAKLTKGDVRDYYEAVAAPIVAAMKGRPLAMEQWPQGIHKPGFFRHTAAGAPAWISVAEEHLVIDRPETVAWLANQSALTFHMTGSRVGSLDSPDWAVIDFDPAGDDFAEILPLAKALKGLLDELKLHSYPKTSGKRGLHVFVPVAPGHTWAQIHGFARSVADVLAAKFPDAATTERMKKQRRGRLYLDAEQNARGKTIVAPYSIRATDHAQVSAPLAWDEVDARLSPAQFTIRSMPKRLKDVGDLFAPVLRSAQRLPVFKE